MVPLDLHLHPMLVHFPVALFVSALGLGVVSVISRKSQLYQTAIHLYVLAALTTLLVVQTGLWEAERLHLKHPIFNLHKTFGLLLMFSSLLSLVILWLSRRLSERHFKIAFFILAVLMTGFVSIAAFYGGKMVFEYGVGVEM